MSRIPSPDLLGWLLLGALLAACPGPPSDQPDTPRVPPFRGPAPGRAARVVSVAGQPFMAALDPASGALVAGAISPDNTSSLDQLDLLSKDADRRIALTGSGDQVALAWRDDEGALRLATRRLGQSPTDWLVERVEASADAPFTFTASDDLAIALGASGEQLLLVRDPTRRGLIALRRIPGSSWRLELVDDGLGSGLESCPVELRQDTRRGLGFMPALLASGREVVAAYHDADCGDLRIARRGEARWLVTVVDTGDDPAAQPSEGITGRFPSLAISPLGVLTIAYQDASRGRLMFAAINGEVITRQIVDPGTTLDPQGKRRREVVGAFTASSFDRQGRAVISHLNATQTEVLVVRGLDAPGAQPIRWSSPTVLLGERTLAGFHATHLYAEDGGLLVAAEQLDVVDGQLVSTLALREENP